MKSEILFSLERDYLVGEVNEKSLTVLELSKVLTKPYIVGQ